MTRDDLIAAVVAAARADSRVQALLLAGGLGRGEGDAFSDVDLIAVVAPEDHGGFAAGRPHGLAPAPTSSTPTPRIPAFQSTASSRSSGCASTSPSRSLAECRAADRRRVR